jgi:hypothetical protein
MKPKLLPKKLPIALLLILKRLSMLLMLLFAPLPLLLAPLDPLTAGAFVITGLLPRPPSLTLPLLLPLLLPLSAGLHFFAQPRASSLKTGPP